MINKDQQILEMAQRFLAELMLNHPEGPTTEVTEALAASVALYLEVWAKKNNTPIKWNWREFKMLIEDYMEEEEKRNGT